jgi:hypothetical protein
MHTHRRSNGTHLRSIETSYDPSADDGGAAAATEDECSEGAPALSRSADAAHLAGFGVCPRFFFAGGVQVSLIEPTTKTAATISSPGTRNMAEGSGEVIIIIIITEEAAVET